MTKSEIVERITRQSGMKRKEVLYIIDNFLDKIKESIDNGEKVEIRGFGTFHPADKKARKIYSPIAEKEIAVPAKTTMAFKPSKSTERELEPKGA
ncbi:MAG TPA: HU family DNA-binding protein [Spirochaetota bacterium]|nr:HU family DNA-binding protein [Spirochaetota bacterium]HPI89414.1 HU family DNA-binding protein [Spirochaetota bacterium]HPR49624.1 HU family DNA-binding protein [Spirochaetota bacterium]